MKHTCMLSRDALAAGHRACLDRYGHEDARTVEFYEALRAIEGAAEPPPRGAQGGEIIRSAENSGEAR